MLVSLFGQKEVIILAGNLFWGMNPAMKRLVSITCLRVQNHWPVYQLLI